MIIFLTAIDNFLIDKVFQKISDWFLDQFGINNLRLISSLVFINISIMIFFPEENQFPRALVYLMLFVPAHFIVSLMFFVTHVSGDNMRNIPNMLGGKVLVFVMFLCMGYIGNLKVSLIFLFFLFFLYFISCDINKDKGKKHHIKNKTKVVNLGVTW